MDDLPKTSENPIFQMLLTISVALGINLISSAAYDYLSDLAKKILEKNIEKIESSAQQERYREEWSSELDSIDNKFKRLWFALSLSKAVQKFNWDNGREERREVAERFIEAQTKTLRSFNRDSSIIAFDFESSIEIFLSDADILEVRGIRRFAARSLSQVARVKYLNRKQLEITDKLILLIKARVLSRVDGSSFIHRILWDFQVRVKFQLLQSYHRNMKMCFKYHRLEIRKLQLELRRNN
jgi:hypothetical protein